MCNGLHTIPACDGQTDRCTDRRTDILPRHSPRYAYASRGKNDLLSISGTESPPKVKQFFRLVGPIVRPSFNETGCSDPVPYTE